MKRDPGPLVVDDPPGVGRCEDCGTTNGVTGGTCPYASEMFNKDVPVDLCRECRRERARDI